MEFSCDIQASIESYKRQWETIPGLVKIQEDLDRYDMVIKQTKPEVLIECGTHKGVSASWFAERIPSVISIDIDDIVDEELREHNQITWIIGSSTNADIVNTVTDLIQNRTTMVILDSDHSTYHVLNELEIYTEMTSPGQYLIVEDGICRYVSTPVTGNGPLEAIETFFPKHGWERDTNIEGMFPATHHLGGWWLKN